VFNQSKKKFDINLSQCLIVSLHPGNQEKVKENGLRYKEFIEAKMQMIERHTQIKPVVFFLPLSIDKINNYNDEYVKKHIDSHLTETIFDPILKSDTFKKNNCKSIAILLDRNKIDKVIFEHILKSNFFAKSSHIAICYGGKGINEDNSRQMDIDLFFEEGKTLSCTSKSCHHCSSGNWSNCNHTCYWRLLLYLYNRKEKIKSYLISLVT